MPQIGWFEILIIVSIAIIIIGPKDFPIMLKKIGSWIGSIKRYINYFQSEVSNLEKKLGKEGRVLIRPSGTEDLLRVMVEASSKELADELAKGLSEFIRKAA